MTSIRAVKLGVGAGATAVWFWSRMYRQRVVRERVRVHVRVEGAVRADLSKTASDRDSCGGGREGLRLHSCLRQLQHHCQRLQAHHHQHVTALHCHPDAVA